MAKNVFKLNLANFNGMSQVENPLVPIGDSTSVPVYDLRNLRPMGRRLAKVKGYSQHSLLQYKLADRPCTLIDWSDTLFLTAWDNIFMYVGTTWIPLLEVAADATTTAPIGTLVNTDNPENAADTNTFFDHVMYNDSMYLTDGYNWPIRIDNNFTAGTWGYRPITTLANAGLLAASNSDVAGATGILANAVRYKVVFYDSVNDKESPASTTYYEFTPTANENINIYVTKSFADEGGYMQLNGFSDKIRIYRTPGDNTGGSASDTTLYYLVDEVDNVPIAGGSCTITGAVLTDDDATSFGDVNSLAGYACYTNAGGGADGYYYIVSNTGATLTLADMDDTSTYTGTTGGSAADYTVLPCVQDTAPDITTNTLLYSDDTTTYPHISSRDHNPPPKCKVCAVFGDRANRVFMANDEDHLNRLYYSHLDEPDYWPLANWIDIDPDDGDEITALMPFQGRLLVFKKRSVAVVTVLGAPVEWTVTARYLTVGAEHHGLVTECRGTLIFVNTLGIFAWDGNTLSHLSHNRQGSNIIDYWDDKVVIDQLKFARGVFNAERNEYWLAVTLDDQRGLYDSALDGYGTISVGEV